MRVSSFLASLAAAVLLSASGHAQNKHLEVPPEQEATQSAAYRYANLDDAAVVRELAARGVPYVRVDEKVAGVRLPIRLTGPLHGVAIHSTVPPEQRPTSPFEILDARLALALDDFCQILAQHEVVELVHFTIYRAPSGSAASGQDSPQTRHPGGMAIDVGALKKQSGQWLSVLQSWPSDIGAKTCGPGARKLAADFGRELQSIVCEAADLRIFHFMLTPHFNAAHADHLHLEIKPEVKWFLVN